MQSGADWTETCFGTRAYMDCITKSALALPNNDRFALTGLEDGKK